jgi:hypothetical protein
MAREGGGSASGTGIMGCTQSGQGTDPERNHGQKTRAEQGSDATPFVACWPDSVHLIDLRCARLDLECSGMTAKSE